MFIALELNDWKENSPSCIDDGYLNVTYEY